MRDREGRTFGALCSELREPEARKHDDPKPSTYFYGRSGQCCLLALSASAPPAVRCFGCSGVGRQFISSGPDRLVIGAGGQHADNVGLMLDGTLSRGTSGPCETYNNPPLPLASSPEEAPLPRSPEEAPT